MLKAVSILTYDELLLSHLFHFTDEDITEKIENVLKIIWLITWNSLVPNSNIKVESLVSVSALGRPGLFHSYPLLLSP